MILSPGVLASCFEMLEIIGRQPISFSQITRALPRIGVCRTDDTLALAQNLSWIIAGNEGLAELTASGRKIVSIAPHEDRLFQAILDFIDIFRPSWIQNASFGRHKVLSYAGTETKQVFFEAGLAVGTDERTVNFWDMLAARARGQKGDFLNAIGRRGERLTLRQEELRTGKQPKWVSLDNNADGYDVLSIVGPNDEAQLSIEVKATTMGFRGAFHITRTEWDRASSSSFHCFHLWVLNNASNADSLLAVVSPEKMKPHVPINLGLGVWESFVLPFEAFRREFQSPASVIVQSGKADIRP